MVQLLKRLPIDLGQGNLRATTKGKLIARSLVPPAGDSSLALDAGCREGIQTRWLQAQGYKVVATDIDPGTAGAVAVDLEKSLPFPDGKFDLVWCSEVIEHLENPVDVVNEFRRVLKPGGAMILTTPNSAFWIYPVLGILGLTPQRLQAGPHHEIQHKQFFSIDDIRSIFPRATIVGYFPYAVLKFAIGKGVGLLSPTFIIREYQ